MCWSRELTCLCAGQHDALPPLRQKSITPRKRDPHTQLSGTPGGFCTTAVGAPCLTSLLAPNVLDHRDLVEKPFFPKLLSYMISGPVVCMAWEGKDIVAMGRKMLGATNPLESNPGTIRGDYSLEVGAAINMRQYLDFPHSSY